MTTLHFSISEAAERRLTTSARSKGVSVDEYASEVLGRLGTFESYDETMAPVRKQYEKSGMKDAELDSFITEIREDIYRKKNRKLNESPRWSDRALHQ